MKNEIYELCEKFKIELEELVWDDLIYEEIKNISPDEKRLIILLQILDDIIY